MTRDESIIELGCWLRTPPGAYMLAWAQERLDHAVSDVFGYHALQLGLPELEGLRANRMPHRWVVTDTLLQPQSTPCKIPPLDEELASTLAPPQGIGLHAEFDALPLPNASIDLVLLPHALELARDPHATLREVERVLVPEGRVVIAGFNPTSLWGLRQRAGHAARGLGVGRDRSFYLPSGGEFLGYWRLRDWLRLLGFEVEVGRFGCWRPAVKTDTWLQRFAWMDKVGDRWWPVLGAVYFLVAVKRVRGMHLVGKVRTEKRPARAATAVVANRQPVTELRQGGSGQRRVSSSGDHS